MVLFPYKSRVFFNLRNNQLPGNTKYNKLQQTAISNNGAEHVNQNKKIAETGCFFREAMLTPCPLIYK